MIVVSVKHSIMKTNMVHYNDVTVTLVKSSIYCHQISFSFKFSMPKCSYLCSSKVFTNFNVFLLGFYLIDYYKEGE